MIAHDENAIKAGKLDLCIVSCRALQNIAFSSVGLNQEAMAEQALFMFNNLTQGVNGNSNIVSLCRNGACEFIVESLRCFNESHFHEKTRQGLSTILRMLSRNSREIIRLFNQQGTKELLTSESFMMFHAEVAPIVEKLGAE